MRVVASEFVQHSIPLDEVNKGSRPETPCLGRTVPTPRGVSGREGEGSFLHRRCTMTVCEEHRRIDTFLDDGLHL